MKRIKSGLVLLSAVLLIAFAFTSCNFTEMMYDKPTTQPTTKKIVQDTTAADNSADDVDGKNESAGDSGTNAVLKAALKTDSFKAQLKKAKEKAKGSLNVKAEVDGSTLIYKYTYLKRYSDSQLKSIKSKLDSKKLKATAEKMIKTMVKNGYDDFVVSFRYYSKEGNLIKKADFDKSILE